MLNYIKFFKWQMTMKSQNRTWVAWAETKNCAGMVGNFGVIIGIFIDLTVVMALNIPSYAKIHQTVHFKNVQFMLD